MPFLSRFLSLNVNKMQIYRTICHFFRQKSQGVGQFYPSWSANKGKKKWSIRSSCIIRILIPLTGHHYEDENFLLYKTISGGLRFCELNEVLVSTVSSTPHASAPTQPRDLQRENCYIIYRCHTPEMVISCAQKPPLLFRFRVDYFANDTSWSWNFNWYPSFRDSWTYYSSFFVKIMPR